MKRKIRKFASGDVVYEKEDEGLLGGKIKYREDEEGRKYVPGRANPMDPNPREQRYYSKEDLKKGLSSLGDKISDFFGGRKDSAAFQDLEAVGGPGRRPRTIEEQIGRKAETTKPVAKQGASITPLTGTDLKQSSGVEERPITDIKKSSSADTTTDKDADKIVEKLRENTPRKKKPAKVSDDKDADKIVEKLRENTPRKKKPAKASDKVGKGYEKLDSRDTGYSGVTKQEDSQSFGGAADKSKPYPTKLISRELNADEEMNASIRRRKFAEKEREKKEKVAKAAKNKTKDEDNISAPGTKIGSSTKSTYAVQPKVKTGPAVRVEPRLAPITRPSIRGGSSGGGGGGSSAASRQLQLGSELDPKELMRRDSRFRSRDKARHTDNDTEFKRGGAVKSTVRSASSRADGIAIRGKTRA